MKVIIAGAELYRSNTFEKSDILIEDGRIVDISPSISKSGADVFYPFNNCFIFPGLVDVHVHLREPGFIYKETIKTGTSAAAHGGFTHICPMPNLDPVPDCLDNLSAELEAIRKDAVIDVSPYGAVTVGEKGEELAKLCEMSQYVCAFSDDGRGIQSSELMEKAMLEAKKLGKILAAHCEVNSLLKGGYIHDGEYARLHGHRGICSESEWRMIERDLEIAGKTGAKYHVCHISCKESVELIRRAKARGVDVTSETAPHYLVFNDMDLTEDARFKMNPPLRSEEDRLALIDGIVDGTIDMISTDHAPHSPEEKSRGLENSPMGVVGLETSFAVMYTHLVKTGVISLEKLLLLMHDNASRRFYIGGELEIGKPADLTVFSLDDEWVVASDEFLSKGRATPFEGKNLFGKCLLTMYDGKVVYSDKGVVK